MSSNTDNTGEGDFWGKLLEAYPRSERFGGEHVCPRGAEDGREGRAVWKSDETCSYCGSLHPEVLMERLRAGSVELEPTDKNYKVYVRAMEGTALFTQTYRGSDCPGGEDPSLWKWTVRETRDTKFYFQHLSEAKMHEFVGMLNAGTLRLAYPGRFYVLPFFVCVKGAPDVGESPRGD